MEKIMKPIRIGTLVFETGNQIRQASGMHGGGSVCREYKTLKPKKSMCSGCYCNDYNYGLGGAKECWSFKGARVVDKVGHSTLNVTHGPDVIMKKTLSCWHAVRK